MDLMEVLAKVGFDWRLALTNLVNFGLIVWLLAKFLWPSISKAIGERQKIINQGLADAEAAKEHLTKSQADYQAKLVQAHQEAQDIARQADERGQKIKEQAQQTAHQEAEELRQRVAGELAREKDQMTMAVRQQSVELVATALEKVLQEILDSSTDEKIIQQAIKALHG